MTDKPRRYVRVWRNKRYVRAWEYRCEFCGPGEASGYFADQVTPAADIHARTCPAVRAAMERDQLQRAIDTQLGDCSCHPDGDDYWDDRCALHGWSYRDWTDMADDLDKELAKVQDMRDRYKAALESCEAAYGAAQREWEDRKTHFRADLDRALDELDRMRTDRDRLRDRLHQINPLSKDSNR